MIITQNRTWLKKQYVLERTGEEQVIKDRAYSKEQTGQNKNRAYSKEKNIKTGQSKKINQNITSKIEHTKQDIKDWKEQTVQDIHVRTYIT